MENEIIEIYDGGLATLFTSDPDYDESSGQIVAPLEGIADLLADHGRFEDVYMVHAAEGETVVPMEVFERNPALKAALWAEMQAMGIEPERYVVGNQLNSLNPVTGQPEFFLKKLFKGVGKALKGVVKVLKKAAPVILPIAMNFIPGVGPILAGALGSGIGTLIKTGNVEDALKAAVIGGVTGGIFKGVSGVLGGSAKGAAAASTQSAASKAAADAGVKASLEAAVPAVAKDAATQAATQGVTQTAAQAATQAGTQAATQSAAQAATTAAQSGLPEVLEKTATQGGFLDSVKEFITPGADGKGLFKNTLDFVNPFNKGPTDPEVFAKANELIKEAAGQGLELSQSEAIAMATKRLTPSVLQKWGPLAGVGLLGMGAAGGFEQPEVDTPDPWAAERSQILSEPWRYQIGLPDYSPHPARGYQHGGPVNGPGTGTSDDVPAWLSDGEFVFTAKAVRGAGGGSRQKGVKTLATLMKNMEARA